MISYAPLWKQMKEKKMTKKQLAETACIPQMTLTRMSQGNGVGSETLNRICRALNCTLDQVAEYVPCELPEEPQEELISPDPE